MKSDAISFEAGLSALPAEAWIERVAEIGREFGTYEPLGDDHHAVFLEAGPKLIVTFEHSNRARGLKPRAEPRGFAYARRDGWSVLTILSDGPSWFREPAIYSYFDTLTDDGFFDRFDDVLFYGAVEGGYAACAYSVAAPGARVLALSPAATLTPSLAGFDPRGRDRKRDDFTSRYGHAPSMVDAASEVYLAYDPLRRLEATHAAMFVRDHVTHLPAFGVTGQIEATLEQLDILEDIIKAAMAGSLSRFVFADQYRARREHAPYLRLLIQKAIERGHLTLAAHAATRGLALVDDPELTRLHDEVALQADAGPEDHVSAAE